MPPLSKLSRRDLTPEMKRAAVANQTFTTGEIARLIGVAPRTVSKWIDLGKFPSAYRLPKTTGTSQPGDRRVGRQDLIDFCVQNKMALPLQALCPDEKRNMLVIGLSPLDYAALTEATDQEAWAVHQCDTVFDLACAMIDRVIDAVVVDRCLGKDTIRLIWKKLTEKLRRQDHCPALLVVLHEGDDLDVTLPASVWHLENRSEFQRWTDSI